MLVKFEIQDTIQYNNCILNINTLQNRKRYKIQVYREKKTDGFNPHLRAGQKATQELPSNRKKEEEGHP